MEKRQSEPKRLGEILPETMQNIRERMENKTETMPPMNTGHQARVFEAVGAFMAHKIPLRRFRCASSRVGFVEPIPRQGAASR